MNSYNQNITFGKNDANSPISQTMNIGVSDSGSVSDKKIEAIKKELLQEVLKARLELEDKIDANQEGIIEALQALDVELQKEDYHPTRNTLENLKSLFTPITATIAPVSAIVKLLKDFEGLETLKP